MSDRRASIRRANRRNPNPAMLPAATRLGLTVGDQIATEAFRNFLSWRVAPGHGKLREHLPPVPPAWYAYTAGLTGWCPPAGEL